MRKGKEILNLKTNLHTKTATKDLQYQNTQDVMWGNGKKETRENVFL